jgi:DivIVA domain-containing protein
MLDESFRLTVLDVRRFDFGSALRGYDKARVDQFREQVAAELERLTRANQELETKARGFHEQLKSFRDRDKAMNDALVSAQQLRGEIREQAEREGQLIIREAHVEAERQGEALRSELRRLEDEVASLDRLRRTYLAQLRMILERQLAELTSAESMPFPDVSGQGMDLPSGGAFGPVRPSRPTPAWLDSLGREEPA